MPHAVPAVANPFPGLRPFREGEERLFFGREGQVDHMVTRLAGHRFLAVLGGSGSGKSSLVNCGLRPALHRGLMGQAGTSWRIAQFRPGRHPLRALAEALAAENVLFPPAGQDALPVREYVEATLQLSKLGVVDIVQQARLDGHTNILLVADQFEELFRYRHMSGEEAQAVTREATAFINLLLEAAAAPGAKIYVVLTMRSDFLGDCAQFSGLPEAINQGQYLIPRLTREERRAAIVGPVAVAGGTISPVLLTRLVNDVGDNPDQLSILQHALNRTWAHWINEGRGEGAISVDHYEAIGTMAGALDKHAEKAFAELSPSQQVICERLFKALTDTETDARGIRRPTPFGTLRAIADAEATEVAAVIDAFRKSSRSFLMPPIEDKLVSETVVDISHESLMRLWKRLGRWAHEEAASAELYGRLADAADRHGRGEGDLYSGLALASALKWRQDSKPTSAWADLYGGGFEQSMIFLDASEAERERENAEAEAAREREIEQARQLAIAQASRARLLRLGLAFSIAAAVAGCTLGFYAWKARNEARNLLGSARGTQATNLTSFLASYETPPSPTDYAVLWGLFMARPEVVSEVLEVVFTQPEPMRKATTRGYALRRAIIGFDGRNTALVKEKLAQYCEPGQMSTLAITGACIAVQRGLYPADPKWVMATEDVLRRNWGAWEKDGETVLETPFRDWVSGQLLTLVHSLDTAGAAEVAHDWQKYVTDKQIAPDSTWGRHIRNGWNRAVENMDSAGQIELAQNLMHSGQRDDYPAASHPMVMLAGVTGPEIAADIWENLLNRPERRENSRWLLEFVKVAPRFRSPDSAGFQRILASVDPLKLDPAALGVWLWAVRTLARQTTHAERIAIAKEIVAKPAASLNAWYATEALLASMKPRGSTPALEALIQRTITTLNRLERSGSTAQISGELARFPGLARTALDSDLRNPGKPASPVESVDLAATVRPIRRPTDRIRMEIVRWVQERVEYEIKFGQNFNESDKKVYMDLFRAVQKAGFSGPWESSFDDHLNLACLKVMERRPQRFSEQHVARFRNLVYGSKNKEPAITYLLADPAHNENVEKRIEHFLAIARYVTKEIRALLYDSRAFSDFLDILLAIDVPNQVRQEVLRGELLNIEKAHRSVALCYRLDPADENSSAALRMLDKWGGGGGVDQVVVGQILQWPDCPPNGVFPIIRKLADLKKQPRKDAGDRLGLVVMEQFADWATKNGYHFEDVRQTPKQ